MLHKFVEKLCEKLDASPRLQRIIQITPREERIAKRLFIPAIAAGAAIVFLMVSVEAKAAQPDFRQFVTVHEVKPVLSPKTDAGGQPVSVVNQVDLLVQLPGERVARRIRAPLSDTLFLDPEGSGHRDEGCMFEFILPNGLPAKGYVGDAGFGELSIHAAVNPRGNWVRTLNAGFDAGDATAQGWLERERGAWLQSSQEMLTCRRALGKSLAELNAVPKGFGDRGRVIL